MFRPWPCQETWTWGFNSSWSKHIQPPCSIWEAAAPDSDTQAKWLVFLFGMNIILYFFVLNWVIQEKYPYPTTGSLNIPPPLPLEIPKCSTPCPLNSKIINVLPSGFPFFLLQLSGIPRLTLHTFTSSQMFLLIFFSQTIVYRAWNCDWNGHMHLGTKLPLQSQFLQLLVVFD